MLPVRPAPLDRLAPTPVPEADVTMENRKRDKNRNQHEGL